ncbi:hypothetical protein [Microscilla marina]|uniref:Uncharacterized protein n=1 Tax=Microscilla marina ATCC 23134 TaxID=313606 RepID=A1ZF22_MICM2|nr:hypothetical protein [Microscilla marina]EAY31124.1 hypothetical protein M23134_07532 [Microscilla marina ATCC 23134]
MTFIISKKKPFFPISENLRTYLSGYGRHSEFSLNYNDLLRYTDTFPLEDRYGKDTLWETVIYPQYAVQELHSALSFIYAILKMDGDKTLSKHLYIDRIDYCRFANSKPFRIRVVNQFNDNYDYFYVKQADASRVYGLELEHILSPNRINYLVYKDTLIEEHIAGIPGDTFIETYLTRKDVNKVRIAKEFVKFNERCFVKLLGDMRSYNYVIDITPDFEDEQYRVRAIDFDQQSYEGRHKMYLAQFFKENNVVVELVQNLINPETLAQYQLEERTLMSRRVRQAHQRMHHLMSSMRKDTLSKPEKVTRLKQEMKDYHNEERFLQCKTMGDIVYLNMQLLLVENLKVD